MPSFMSLDSRARMLALALCVPVLSLPAGAQSQSEDRPRTPDAADPVLQDVILVTAARPATATELAVRPDAAPLQGGDLTYLSARTPGGARIANGELSGQMQYRGLFGERLNLRVNGQRFASGGPNLMDPVFHYAPAPLVATLVIDRGVSPVSEGPGLAGGANAVFKSVPFAEGAAVSRSYDLTVGGRSVNDSVLAGGVVGAATDRWRVNLLGSWEAGDDTRFGDGTIGGTEFERGVFGASAAVRSAVGTVSLDVRRQNTGPSGNPPFPMDIRFFDTDFLRIGYERAFAGLTVEAELHATDVAHGMNNFSLRPAPEPMRQRETLADATTRGAALSATMDAWGGRLRVGSDAERVEHDVRITNPTNVAFFVTPFPKVMLDRLGGHAEWTGPFGPFRAELGVRADRHHHEAGTVRLGPALPMGPRGLAGAFNAADRSIDETTLDAVARLWTAGEGAVTWRATLARKQKMPGYIQRFGWLPINASGGLADGNIYVGDLGLDPETAWIAEVGFDLSTHRAYLRPTVWLRQIDDYVQGVPFDDTVGVVDTPVEMVAAANGDATPLRWANVDARLVGVDLDGGYDLAGPLRLDGLISHVRGERRDTDDDLYRITPSSLTAGLTWEQSVWSTTLEVRAVDRQDRVSATNEEAETPGYVVLSVYGDWTVRPGLRLSAGVENLLDQVYEDHLAGYNRNGRSDVALGERIPGAGRGVFLRLNLSG